MADVPTTAVKLAGLAMTPDGALYVTGISSGLTIDTTTITGGATTQVLFNLSGKVSSSAQFTYGDTLVSGGPGIKVGTTGTSNGWQIGYLGASGFAGIWNSALTPGISNYALVQSSTGATTLNAASSTLINIANNHSTMASFSATAFQWTSSAKPLFSVTAPTVASGGCTSPGAITANGTAAFTLASVGTSCSGSQPLVFTFPAATTGWRCEARNVTNGATSAPAQTGAVSTTSVTITNFDRTTGLAAAWTDADVIVVGPCHGY